MVEGIWRVCYHIIDGCVTVPMEGLNQDAEIRAFGRLQSQSAWNSVVECADLRESALT